MSRKQWTVLAIVVVVVSVVIGAGVVVWRQLMPREYKTAISMCPAGATTADLVIYHRSALDGHAEQVTRKQVDCSPGLETRVDRGTHPREPVDQLPLTIIVAQAGGREQTTWLYQLPEAAGFFVQQKGVAGSREDRTWDIPLDDQPTTVDPASLPAAPQ